ncbi:threonine--tRNA ligase [Spiroplasma sp. BIUS-1]|uniref:threonine--tRNA ligase n=1 Tax=Spiroplasma sp. BIUS-1 TaxID=216964 RepID=UPI0013992D9A|nr:TGS domain-containing protein [Spiroplasma sp. BIUS-1]QHX36382.1 threonyl-tRNA synthetase [Spiroplasma sp. BIUS-1]
MKLTLLDGSVLVYDEPKTVLDIAMDISPSLNNRCVGAYINSNYMVSCFTIINKDCKIEFVTERHDMYYQIVNYTAKLVTILAMVDLYPDLDQIVQDGDNSKSEFNLYFKSNKYITVEDFPAIEKRAKEIIDSSYPIGKYLSSKEIFVTQYKKIKVKGNLDKLIEMVEKKYISYPVLKLRGEAFFALCGTLKNTNELYDLKLTSTSDYLLEDGCKVQVIYGIAATSETKMKSLERILENKKLYPGEF